MENTVTFAHLPLHLNAEDIPSGISECAGTTGLEFARFALDQLRDADSGFPTDFLPKETLVRCALLGSYNVHNRNYEYSKSNNLQSIIEEKINSTQGSKYIISVNSKEKYYCFELNEFKYKIIDELKESTNSVDFILIIPDVYGCFVFFEDSPACFMSFKDETEFEKYFMPREKALSIFSKSMNEWQITNYDRERKWLESVDISMK